MSELSFCFISPIRTESNLTGRYSWRTALKKGNLKADGPCLIEKNRMTIASLLQDNDYSTAMVGKWHLQMEFEGTRGKERDWSKPFTEGPIEKGFDYFFDIPASMNYGILTFKVCVRSICVNLKRLPSLFLIANTSHSTHSLNLYNHNR